MEEDAADDNDSRFRRFKVADDTLRGFPLLSPGDGGFEFA